MKINNSEKNLDQSLYPEIRIYENPSMITYEASIRSGILKDYYINPLKQIINNNNNNNDNKIKFVSSIQKRAWSTILPLAKALNKDIYKRKDTHIKTSKN